MTQVIINEVKERAEELIRYAEEVGMVVTIDLQPLQPLAMGHHKMVADVQPKHPY